MSNKQQDDAQNEATELAEQDLDQAVGGLRKAPVKRREDPCAGGE